MHTNGPWQLSSNVFVGDSPFPAILDPHGLVVCDVLDDGKSEEETLANASLIAAAPEMLKSLLQIVNLFSTGVDPRLDEALASAREVTARVMGRD